MTVSDYLEQIKQQYPDIRPYREEEDLEWWNQGLDLIKAGRLDEAEEIFKKLVLAQPEHSDGFNGLGLVYENKATRPRLRSSSKKPSAEPNRWSRTGIWMSNCST